MVESQPGDSINLVYASVAQIPKHSKVIWTPQMSRIFLPMRFQIFQAAATKTPPMVMYKGIVKSPTIPSKVNKDRLISKRRNVLSLSPAQTELAENDRITIRANTLAVTGKNTIPKNDPARVSHRVVTTKIVIRTANIPGRVLTQRAFWWSSIDETRIWLSTQREKWLAIILKAGRRSSYYFCLIWLT